MSNYYNSHYNKFDSNAFEVSPDITNDISDYPSKGYYPVMNNPMSVLHPPQSSVNQENTPPITPSYSSGNTLSKEFVVDSSNVAKQHLLSQNRQGVELCRVVDKKSYNNDSLGAAQMPSNGENGVEIANTVVKESVNSSNAVKQHLSSQDPQGKVLCRIVDKKSYNNDSLGAARTPSDGKINKGKGIEMAKIVEPIMPGTPEYYNLSPDRQRMIDLREELKTKESTDIESGVKTSREKVSRNTTIVPSTSNKANLQGTKAAAFFNVNRDSEIIVETDCGVFEESTNILTNFKVEIVMVYILMSDDTNEAKDTILDLDVTVFNNSRNIQRIIKGLSLETAQSADWLKQIPMAIVNSKSKSTSSAFMYRYINKVRGSYFGDIRTLYESSGWKVSEKVYVTSRGVVGGSSMLLKAQGDFSLRNDVNNPSFEMFSQMLNVTANHANMRIMLLYQFASFIFSLFTQASFSINHVLVIVGEKGCKKTSTAKCFLQFGEDKVKTKFNFASSDSGILNNLKYYADRVMLVDDMPPALTQAQANADNSKLNLLLRIAGDNGTRTINTSFMKNPEAKPDYKVRGGIVITGERFHGSGPASSIARAVVLSFDKNEVNLNALSYFQQKENEVFLEALFYRYLSFVSANFDVTIEYIRNSVYGMRQQARNYSWNNDRYFDYYAVYMITASIVAKFFKSEDMMFNEESFLEESEKDIVSILTDNESSYRNSDPIDQLLAALIFAINTSPVGKEGDKVSDSMRFIIIDGTLYLRQMDLPDIMKAYSLKTNTPIVSSSSQFLGELLASNEYCEVYYETEGEKQKRRLSKKRGKAFGNQRLMAIDYNKLKAFEAAANLGF